MIVLDRETIITKINSCGKCRDFNKAFIGDGGAYWSLLESWQNHVVNCKEIKLCKILGLNVKLRNDVSRFSPIITVKSEEKLPKCDKHGRSPIIPC